MSSSRVGSVFLGDIQRHRNISAHSSPPSSPPAAVISNRTQQPTSHQLSFDSGIDMDSSERDSAPVVPQRHDIVKDPRQFDTSKPREIDPVLALELRLRWLEALVVGVKQDTGKDKKGQAKEEYQSPNLSSAIAAANLKPGDTLVRITETLQQRLHKSVEANDALKKFMNKYDQHAQLLTPSFALSGLLADAPTYENLTPQEIDALLVEMEPDIRAADRDMQEIDGLEKKGATGSGHLPEYEEYETRLQKLVEGHEENMQLANALEKRIANLVNQHATYVDTLSELFVAWDDIIAEAEGRVSRMERERAERLRKGFE